MWIPDMSVLIFLLLQVSYTLTQRSDNASCVPISNCPGALKLSEERVSNPNTVPILRKAHCGYTHEALVLCDLVDRALVDLYVASLLGQRTQNNSRCIAISQCTAAVRLTQEKRSDPRTATLLRNAHCGYQNEAMVQCDLIERESPNILGTTTGDNSSSRKCIPISQCSAAQTLVDQRAPNLVSLLQRAHCGYDEEAQVDCTLLETAIADTPSRGSSGGDDCVPSTQCPEATKLLIGITGGQDIQRVLGSAYCGVDNRVIQVKCSTLETTRSEKLPNPDLLECGYQDTPSKVTGGEETALEEFPWLALIYYKGKARRPSCHGSLINSRYILTAAHCLDQRVIDMNDLGKVDSVVLGEYDLRNSTDCIEYEDSTDCADPPKEYFIESVIVHENFQLQMAQNDIGLIRLTEDVVYSEFIKPICLPLRTFSLTGSEKFWVGGWGKTEIARRSPIKLRAEVPFVNKAACSRNWRRNLNDDVVCAGTNDGKDSCKGDSGGPLMYPDDDQPIVFEIGVVSFGHSPCGSGPAVYTFVPRYIDWIENNIL